MIFLLVPSDNTKYCSVLRLSHGLLCSTVSLSMCSFACSSTFDVSLHVTRTTVNRSAHVVKVIYLHNHEISRPAKYTHKTVAVVGVVGLAMFRSQHTPSVHCRTSVPGLHRSGVTVQISVHKVSVAVHIRSRDCLPPV